MKTEYRSNVEAVIDEYLFYKEVLSDTINYQLLESLNDCKSEIIQTVKSEVEKGNQVLNIMFSPDFVLSGAPIYQFIGKNTSLVSLASCTNAYVYKQKLFGKKQIRYTDVRFNEFMEKFSAKHDDLIELKIVNYVFDQNPEIKCKIDEFFLELGLLTKRKENDTAYVLEVSLQM